MDKYRGNIVSRKAMSDIELQEKEKLLSKILKDQL